MSNLRPCSDPRICGVKNHRPDTACLADKGSRASRSSGPSTGIATEPTSFNHSDSSTDIVRTISDQEGWNQDGFDEWNGDFYAASAEPLDTSQALSGRTGFTEDDLMRERDSVAGIPVVIHNPVSHGADHIELMIMDEHDESPMIIPSNSVPDYLSKFDGGAYLGQSVFTCSRDDLPKAMEWLKDDGSHAAVENRLDIDYPHTKPVDSDTAVSTLRSVNG